MRLLRLRRGGWETQTQTHKHTTHNTQHKPSGPSRSAETGGAHPEPTGRTWGREGEPISVQLFEHGQGEPTCVLMFEACRTARARSRRRISRARTGNYGLALLRRSATPSDIIRALLLLLRMMCCVGAQRGAHPGSPAWPAPPCTPGAPGAPAHRIQPKSRRGPPVDSKHRKIM